MTQIKHKPFYTLHLLRKDSASFAVKLFLLFSFTSLSQNPLIIAHRGASACAPENTLVAFEQAIAMGALVIEIDVHQTKDSVLVVMHDLSVDRTTNGKGLIKDLSSHNFKQLCVKQQKTVLKENPPTLEEVIKIINGRCQLLIEIKKGNSYYPNIEQHIIDLIHTYKAEKWILAIHSFEKEALIHIEKRDSNITLQKLIVFKWPFVNFSFAKRIEKNEFEKWAGVNIHYRFCSKRIVKKIHQQGKTVYVWTVNNPRKAKKCLKRDVDGVISNYPDILNR